MQEIVIPNGVTSIGDYAFYNDYSVKSLQLGNSVKTIGNYAFRGVYNLEGEISFPDSVTTISSSAFSSTITNVDELEIGSGLTTNVPYLLSTFSCLKNITISEDNPSYLSEDGIVFNKDKTQLVKCPRYKAAENYIVPSTVTSIEASAFYNCQSITGNITLPEGLLTIGSSSFGYCTGLTGNLTIPNSVTTIGSSAFSSCTGLTGDLIIPNSVTTIGSSAFSYCTGVTGNLTIPSSVTSLGSYAFSNCTGLTGDLTIPSSITSLGSYAFNNCTGFNGILTIENGLQTIDSGTFYNCRNFSKTIIGNSVTSIGAQSFYSFSDIWIDNVESNVTVNANFSGTNTYIHWQNDKHSVEIITMPGINLINTSTNEIITSGDYDCETSFNYKVQVEDGYNYDNLKIVEMNYNSVNTVSKDLDTSEIYSFDKLLRSRTIYVQNVSKGLDLSLRTFITKVNQTSQSRTPKVNLVNGELQYIHTKYPINVDTGDKISYTIRVYNEGDTAGSANKVSVYIPEGLEYDTSNTINEKYEWKVLSDNKIYTEYLSGKTINGYLGNGNVSYEDIEIVLKVTQESLEQKDARLNIIAEIEEESNKDADSICGSIKSPVESDYKKAESYASTTSSYIKGQEDDDDFEDVVVLKKVQVNYNIKINNINKETKELLSGATYNLLDSDENIIDTKTVDENGTLDFGTFTTYGEGEDVYYIEEAELPDGYEYSEKKKIKITVTKTITDKVQGTYSISFTYNIVEYSIDTTNLEYIPITTAEQLQKIGSGETVIIDDDEYIFSTTNNYKLMNDIDLSEVEEWKPISNIMNCVIDGNGHTISNLTITQCDESNIILSTGLFQAFSGIIKNLNLEDVHINISEIPSTSKFSSSEYTGIGAFAGIMYSGSIIDCTVSGNVIAPTDNVGGFVGHTATGGIVKVVRCTNNATVTTSGSHSNAGGIIGCALGAINITESKNTGAVTCTNWNAGGLVGFVNAKEYSTTEINASLDQENKIITMIVGNSKTDNSEKSSETGKTMEDVSTSVQTNFNKAIISKCKNNGAVSTTLTNAGGIIGTSYSIVEIEKCENNATITTVSDHAAGIIAELRTNNEYWKQLSNISQCHNFGIIQSTGTSACGNVGGIVSYGVTYIKINECTNNNNINSSSDKAAGGIIGDINGFCDVENCINNSDITVKTVCTNGSTTGIAGGIIGRNMASSSGSGNTVNLSIATTDNSIVIKNCKNYGNLSSPGHLGGIIGYTGSYSIQISNCEVGDNYNNIQMYTTYPGDKGGIIGYCDSKYIDIENCNVNNVDFQKLSNGSYSAYGGTGAIVGNICVQGNNTIEIDTVKIYNCTANNCTILNNYATGSYSGSGGIVGKSRYATMTYISNCIVEDCDISCTEVSSGDLDVGGIIGFTEYTNNLIIENSVVKESQITGNDLTRKDECANVGGIIGETYYSNSIVINNCNVSKLKLSTLSGNIGGIIGGQRLSSNTTVSSIKNCNVDEVEIVSEAITGNSDVGGIVGLGNGQVVISDSTVSNSTISAIGLKNLDETSLQGAKNVAGIIGSDDGSGVFVLSNCTVINTDITSELSYYVQNYSSTTAGLVGRAYNVSIYNCSVEKGEDKGNIAGKGNVISGGVASCNTINVGGCSVIGITITDGEDIIETVSRSGTRSMAGLIGSAGGGSIATVNVKDIVIEGSASSMGGVFGYLSTSTLVNCTVENITINQTGDSTCRYVDAVGGLGGTLVTVVGMNIKHNMVNNSTINVQAQVGGGLIGSICSNDAKIEDCTTYNVTIINGNDRKQSNYNATVGGIVGTSTNALTINNSTVQNSNFSIKEVISESGDIAGSEAGYIGGIVGFSSGDVTVDNTKLINTNLDNKTQNGITGGIAGMTTYSSATGTTGEVIKTLTITNSAVEKSDIIGQYHSGGLMGFGKIIAENDEVNDSQIKGIESSADVGGVIGNTLPSSIIKGNTVNNSTVTGTKTIGGIAGLSKAKITNTSVKNSNIVGTSVDSQVGGIAGHSSYEENVGAEDCKVEKSIVTATKGIVGGIFGVSNSTPINSIVTGTEIKTTKDGVFGLF